MRSDLVIRGATGPGGDVAVEGGQIVAIGDGLTGREEVDATGLHLLPGMVDAHVHFNEPGRTDWEGWATGSRALLAGGGTTCVEMPLNAHPPTLDGPAFDAKVKAASASSDVDFALWGGLTPVNLDRLEELAERGVVGFKAFMCDSGIDDFPAADDDTLHAGMVTAARLGLPVAVHAERPARLRTPDGSDWRAWVASRPVEAELVAIETAIAIARETGCSLHIVHVSCAAGVELVARADGVTFDEDFVVLIDRDLANIEVDAVLPLPGRQRDGPAEAHAGIAEAEEPALPAQADQVPCEACDRAGPNAEVTAHDVLLGLAGQDAPQKIVGLQDRRQHRKRRIFIDIGFRDMFQHQFKQTVQVLLRLAKIMHCPALTPDGVHDREVQLLFIGVQRHEQIENLVQHLFGTGVGTVDLVNDNDRPQAKRQCFRQHELRLRHRSRVLGRGSVRGRAAL